ncbi:MAG: hypothetical protein ABI668_07985 [Sphingorhabdus sp.]
MATVKEYVVHCTERALSESLAKATRGNSFIKMTIKKPSNRSFRWVTTDMGL